MPQYRFSSEELSFLMYLIGVKKLYGTALDAKYVESSTPVLSQLKKRGYIISYDNGVCVKDSLSDMFGIWGEPQYGIIRLNDINDRNIVLLVKDDSLLFFLCRDGEYRIIFQKDLDQLDRYISMIAGISDMPHYSNSFNVKIACDECKRLCQKNRGDIEHHIYLTYGIPESWIYEWAEMLQNALPSVRSDVMIYNFTEKTRCRMEIIQATDYICACKRTYDPAPCARIIRGGSEFVLQCIYNC